MKQSLVKAKMWDCVPRVCGGGGGCAGGGVPLGAMPALSWCGEVSLRGYTNHLKKRTKKGRLVKAGWQKDSGSTEA